MQVKDMMTNNPASCTADTPLPKVARLMVEKDCGEIPIVENCTDKLPIGVVTDRARGYCAVGTDLVGFGCRALAVLDKNIIESER
jgi:predicted transcriptional regulator